VTMPPSGPWPPPPPGPGQQPPSWGSQPPWGPPPQRGGNRGKWILGGIALVVVIGLTVVATLLVTRDDSGSGEPTASAPPSTSADTSDIASADDRGPVGIITEDPTCAAWGPINAAFVHASDGGWGRRDPNVPAEDWNPEERAQYQAVGAALVSAADLSIELARGTTHRVMRELYEQFIAYSRAYVDRIPTYRARDDQLVRVAISISTAVTAICDAITHGVAGARAPLVADAAPPTRLERLGDPAHPQRFLQAAIPVCDEWLPAIDAFSSDTEAWRALDPNIPSSQLDASQRDINAAVMPIMREFATTTQLLGRQSENQIFEDFATLSAQYRRAYTSALTTYAVADNYLQIVAGSAAGALTGACRSAEA